MRRLEAIDAAVVERRDLAVLLGRQPLQPGLARVHDERAAARIRNRVDEPLQIRLAVLVVDADAALDGHGHAHTRACMAATQRATSSGSAIRQAPKRPSCTRSDGQPTLRLISS